MSRPKTEIEQLCMFDDYLFRRCFQDCKEGVEYILRTILNNPDLTVKSCKAQKFIDNPECRAARLDIYAEDPAGKLYDVEIQKGKIKKHIKRSRYYSATMDARLKLKPNDDFDNLPESYVIFICSDDIMEADKPMKWFTRKCRFTDEELEDGTNIIFVNGSYTGDDELGKLLSDLRQPDPSRISNGILAKQLALVKTAEINKGDKNMVETYFDKKLAEEHEGGYIEGKINTAINMISKGKYTIDEIAEITELPLDKVKELAASLSA